MEASTIFGDCSDFLKAFPQITLNDYLYRLSIARIQFLATDSTHVKYLKGKDKALWNKYNKMLSNQKKMMQLLGIKN